MTAPRSHTAADIFYGRLPSPPPPSSGCSVSKRLTMRRFRSAKVGACSQHCGTYMSGQPPLHAATPYLHEKRDSLPLTSSSTNSASTIQKGEKAPLEDLPQCKHGSSLSLGESIFQMSPLTLSKKPPKSRFLRLLRRYQGYQFHEKFGNSFAFMLLQRCRSLGNNNWICR